MGHFEFGDKCLWEDLKISVYLYVTTIERHRFQNPLKTFGTKFKILHLLLLAPIFKISPLFCVFLYLEAKNYQNGRKQFCGGNLNRTGLFCGENQIRLQK